MRTTNTENTPPFATMNHQNSRRLDRQELRALTCDYAKQIVAKASELSQTRKNDIDCLQKNRNVTSRYQPDVYLRLDPTSQKALRDAAQQINRKFQANDLVSIGANRNNSDQDDAKFHNESKTNHTYNSQKFHNNVPLQNVPRQDSKSLRNRKSSTQNDSAAFTTTTTMRDYVEQDYATISSSQDDSDSRKGATDHRNANSAGGRSRIKGLHQRINWQVLVSCFSTCLPQTLVQAATSSAGVDRTSRPGTS